MPRILIIIVAIIMLIFVNLSIYKKEKLINKGERVLLELSPVDPRSLIQGDFMILRYKIADFVESKKNLKDGFLVINKDNNDIGQYPRIYELDKSLKKGEFLLRFRKRGQNIRLGAESFFFQEGHAKCYENAKYGELRVSESGESVLTGLCDSEFNKLKPRDACLNIKK